MPDPAETPGPPGQNPARRFARPAVALAAVVLFQLLLASTFIAVLHHPVPHQAPVAVAGRSPLAQVVSDHGGGTARLVAEPTAGAARAALSGGQVNAAIIAGPAGGEPAHPDGRQPRNRQRPDERVHHGRRGTQDAPASP